MNIHSRINRVQKFRDDTRAKIYYYKDAFYHVAAVFNAIDDRIHPGTWRSFTPNANERFQQLRMADALRVQQRPRSGDSASNQNSRVFGRLSPGLPIIRESDRGRFLHNLGGF